MTPWLLIGPCLITSYTVGLFICFGLYVRWRKTGVSAVNPRYIVAGIIAFTGLILTVVCALIGEVS